LIEYWVPYRKLIDFSMTGRSIQIFLVDGTVSGLRTAELGLSTIKALVIPRASLQSVTKRSEVQKTGLYILVGKDENKPGVLKIYVGEGDTILNRLSAHNKDNKKEFWEEAIVFVSKDENLTKSHVRYLEACLIKLAQDAKRCTVVNETEPSEQGKLPESAEVEMQEFIVQAQLLLGTLGYDLFKPFQPNLCEPSEPLTNTQNVPIKLIYSGKNFSANCIVDINRGQFIVQERSNARREETPSLQATYKSLRAQLIDSGLLFEEGDSYVFTQDVAFSSISSAAQVVSGQTVSGGTAWKLADTSQTYAEWQESRIPQTNDS
jgi:Domain of unknown function (DUF4357)